MNLENCWQTVLHKRGNWKQWKLKLELQIPRGSQIRYGEDELYEEMKDTCRQHSQLTAWYCPSCPLILAGLKVIKN